jgi:beta-phosphoglucomutase-like phosphatase (HAD superfamily)
VPLGVIFDVDGLLVLSEPFIAEAAIRMFAEEDLPRSTRPRLRGDAPRADRLAVLGGARRRAR